jgi:glyoxylase-like metal-dependent hydrolase (beta-lactamase superfamily II)
MKIGNYIVDIIETCKFSLDGGAMFGVVPKNLWSKAYPHFDDQNRIDMSARALLIRGNGKTILVDSGCGHKMPDKLNKIYNLDYSEYTLKNELKKKGVDPQDVTDFIYTHLHFDHAGGSTFLNDKGEVEPMFPNAKHYVQTEQLKWARNPSDKDRASFMQDNWEPVISWGLMEELEGISEVLPGIEVRPLYGHTQAMQIVIIKDTNQINNSNNGLVYCADLIPTSAHLTLPYIMGYDNFPLTTLDEKKFFIREAFENNWLLCFEHDPYTQAISLSHSEKGFSIHEKVEINDNNLS